MAKSALDRLKEMPQKKLVEKLGCPQDYGLTGIFTDPDGGCMANHSKDKCYVCWTKKI